MSASDFTEGQQIPRKKHRLREGGLKCVWELTWIHAVLARTLNRLEDQRATKQTMLSCIPAEGLLKGNAAPAPLRVGLPSVLMGISPPSSKASQDLERSPCSEQ